MGFLLGQAKKDYVPCLFSGKKDGDGHLFWECTFPYFCCMFGNFLSLPPLCPWIVVNGPDVFCGVAGCLVSTVLVGGPLGQLLWGSWLVVIWSVV